LTADLVPKPRRRLVKYAFLAAWMILGKAGELGIA